MALTAIVLERAAVLSIGLTLLGSSVAAAQTPTTPPATGSTGTTVAHIPEFARQLAGKNVWVTADGGRVRGVVTSLSPDGLVLIEQGSPTTIAYDKVVRVEKSSHRVRNGALLGLASGVGSDWPRGAPMGLVTIVSVPSQLTEASGPRSVR